MQKVLGITDDEILRSASFVVWNPLTLAVRFLRRTHKHLKKLVYLLRIQF